MELSYKYNENIVVVTMYDSAGEVESVTNYCHDVWSDAQHNETSSSCAWDAIKAVSKLLDKPMTWIIDVHVNSAWLDEDPWTEDPFCAICGTMLNVPSEYGDYLEDSMWMDEDALASAGWGNDEDY